MTSYAISFTAEADEFGLIEATGMMRFNKETGLSIEYLTKDAVLGVIKSDLNRIDIHWKDIIDLELKKGLFSATFKLKLGSMGALSELPNHNNGLFKAKIKKSDFKTAEYLRSALLLYISEQKLESLDT